MSLLELDLISLLLLTLFAGIGGLALLLLVIWLVYPEKIERWSLQIRRLFAYFSEKNERRFIAKDIEVNINSWSKGLCLECPGIAPYGVKISWVDIDKIESSLRDGVLLLKMKNHRNHSKNLAVAVSEFVPNALMPTARRYVKPRLMKGIDYVVSKSMLSRNTSALSYFISRAEPGFIDDSELRPMVEELDTIHGQGLLTRVLLSEYSGLSTLHPKEPTDEVVNETVGLEKKIYQLVTKRPQVDVDPQFNGTFIRAAIVPIAKSATLAVAGTEAHIRFIRNSAKKGIRNFYIVAAGELIRFAKEVVKKSESACGLSKAREDEFTGTFRNKAAHLYCAMLTKA